MEVTESGKVMLEQYQSVPIEVTESGMDTVIRSKYLPSRVPTFVTVYSLPSIFTFFSIVNVLPFSSLIDAIAVLSSMVVYLTPSNVISAIIFYFKRLIKFIIVSKNDGKANINATTASLKGHLIVLST